MVGGALTPPSHSLISRLCMCPPYSSTPLYPPSPPPQGNSPLGRLVSQVEMPGDQPEMYSTDPIPNTPRIDANYEDWDWKVSNSVGVAAQLAAEPDSLQQLQQLS